MKNTLKSIINFFIKEWNDEKKMLQASWKQRKTRRKLKRKAKQLAEAKKMAIAKNKADNKTYYVLRNHKNNFVALNNKEIEMYQKLGYFRKGFDYFTLAKEATFIVRGRS